VADLIVNLIKTRRGENDIDVVVNGASVPVSPSLQDLLARTLLAMIPTPQGNGEVKSLHVSLRRKN